MYVVRAATVTAVIGLVCATGSAQPALEPEATPTLQPTIDRCADFCAMFYSSGSSERAECVAGCADAEACTVLCNERFPGDPEKHTACYKRCMRSRAT